MALESKIALCFSVLFTIIYAYMILKKLSLFFMLLHKVSWHKEHGDFAIAEAEVIEFEEHNLNGLKFDISRYYVMRVQYYTENPIRGLEHSELLFTKCPTEQLGDKITILYSRESPEVAVTDDERETDGLIVFFLKLILSVGIIFTLSFLIIFWIGKYGRLLMRSVLIGG